MKYLALCGASLLGVSFALSSGADAETLKLAHFVPPAHIVNASVVDPLVKGAAADSGGALKINVYPGGELGKGPVEQYPRVLKGVADIVWGVTGYTSSQFQRTMIIEMPGVFKGPNGSKAIQRALDRKLLDSEFPGTKPLAVWTAEPNVIIMRNKEVRSPADLKGMKIRVSGSIPGKIIEALGATAVQMGAAEGYNALQTGLVDGCMTGASAINDFKYDEVADVFILGPALGHVSFYLAMNKAKYDALPANEKAAIDKNSGLKLSQSGEDGWNALAKKTIDRLKADPKKKVIELSQAEVAAFDKISIAARDQLIAEMDKKGLKATETLSVMLGN